MAFNNVTRKNKIQIAVALVIAGALAWGLWPAADDAEVSVTYKGPATNNPFLAWFTVTNSSTNNFAYAPLVAERVAGSRAVKSRTFWGAPPNIAAHSASNYRASAYSTNRWRVEVRYQPILSSSETAKWLTATSPSRSRTTRTREKLSGYVYGHGFPRLSEWIRPNDGWRIAYGPEMLGHKPVATEEK